MSHIEASAAAGLSMDEESLPIGIKHIPVKRIFDVAFSLAVLLLGLPIFLLIALAVRLSSKGSVIYSHERIGRGGKPFKCYKFRTMFADANNRLLAILQKDPALKKEWEENFKLKKDPRVTPLGSFLRKTSLDELPQFWNVLKGDMSVVGPRPVINTEIARYYGRKAAIILSVRPGLTGPWQVSGRSDTSYANRIRMDELYIERQSVWFDLWMIIRTIPCMLFSRGAY